VENISIWDANFVVVDTETTGHSPLQNRIMDIAAVMISNGEIQDDFHSLINPHQIIPPFISQMTKITNDDVANAPEERDIIPKFNEFFKNENTIFVAHNANFDYSFISEAYRRISFSDFNPPILDTLKIARHIFPENQKKGVSSLATLFGIRIRNRHSAYGDAKATAKILVYLLEMLEDEYEIETIEDLLAFQNTKNPHYISKLSDYDFIENKLNTIPEEPGVYYFYNSHKEVIYVGKAKNLRRRIMNYFQAASRSSYKMNELSKHIHDIGWEETNNELSALIQESKKIFELKPKYNTIGRRLRSFPFLKITTIDAFPKVEVTYHPDEIGEYYGPFANKWIAEQIKDIIDKNFQLIKCDKNLKGTENIEPCIYYQMHRCLAPCSAEQRNKNLYENEVQNVRNFLSGSADQLVENLSRKMIEFSNRFEYEKANEIKYAIQSIKKVLNSNENSYNSLADKNFILILPNDSSERLIDIFFFRNSRLYNHQTLGKKGKINEIIANSIHQIYFNGIADNNILTREEINEIKITNAWLALNKDNGKVIYISKESSEELLRENILKSLDKFE